MNLKSPHHPLIISVALWTALIAFFPFHVFGENKVETPFPYEEKTLKNGLRIMMVHNKELPFLKIRFILNRGSLWDPPKKAGLGFLTAQSLKQGTRFHSYSQLSYALGQIGSELNVGVDFDSISFFASTLSKYSESLLLLMKQVFLQPRMDKKSFLRERYKLLQRLNTLSDNKRGPCHKTFLSGTLSFLSTVWTSSKRMATHLKKNKT